MRIGSNISSLVAQRRLSEATNILGQVSERLSSGLRINRASDDAAGLAIAENLNANRRISTVAMRNVSDGQSLLSIADGALAQQTSIITRMQELAAQSANGTFSTAQRSSLDKEFQAIKAEFFRISQTTMFNGLSLLEGTGLSKSFALQVGLTGRDEMLSLSLETRGKLRGRVDLTTTGMNGGTSLTSSWLTSIYGRQTHTEAQLFQSGFDGQIVMTTSIDDQGRERETAVFVSRRLNGAPGDQIFLRAFVRSLNNPNLWEGEVTISDISVFSGGGYSVNSNGTLGTNNTIVFSDDYYGDISINFGNLSFYDGVNGSNQTEAALQVLDVTNAERSRFALDELAKHLAKAASIRGNIGAMQQRLNVAYNNLQVSRESFTAAESRIRDADIAKESADYLRLQVLQQTATQVLKSANLMPELALKLLKSDAKIT